VVLQKLDNPMGHLSSGLARVSYPIFNKNGAPAKSLQHFIRFGVGLVGGGAAPGPNLKFGYN
jgi:hypothetical protein